MKCYLCDKDLKGNPQIVDTLEDQRVYVGPDCFKRIKQSGGTGIPVPGCGELRLYILTPERKQYLDKKLGRIHD